VFCAQISELNDAVCVLQEKTIDAEKNATVLRVEVEQLQQQNAEQAGKNVETFERVSHLQRELSDKAEEIEVVQHSLTCA
jgi:predicted RNase H-like nuclease (RuvC/YqgF family)